MGFKFVLIPLSLALIVFHFSIVSSETNRLTEILNKLFLKNQIELNSEQVSKQISLAEQLLAQVVVEGWAPMLDLIQRLNSIEHNYVERCKFYSSLAQYAVLLDKLAFDSVNLGSDLEEAKTTNAYKYVKQKQRQQFELCRSDLLARLRLGQQAIGDNSERDLRRFHSILESHPQKPSFESLLDASLTFILSQTRNWKSKIELDRRKGQERFNQAYETLVLERCKLVDRNIYPIYKQYDIANRAFLELNRASEFWFSIAETCRIVVSQANFIRVEIYNQLKERLPLESEGFKSFRHFFLSRRTAE